MRTIPRLNESVEYLEVIDGMVPSITQFNKNQCRFANRCEVRMESCNQQEPKLISRDGSQVRCHLLNRGIKMDNILEIQNLKLIILLNQEFSNQLNM